jgi:hypothetical protein
MLSQAKIVTAPSTMTSRLSLLRIEDCDFLPCRGRSDGRPGDGGGDERIYSDGESNPFRGLRPGERVDVEEVDVVEETDKLFRAFWFFMVSVATNGNWKPSSLWVYHARSSIKM